MIKLNLTCKAFFLAVVLSFSVFSAYAANRFSVANGNWNSTATWSATSGGAPGASFPVAGDIVFIENGNTITVTANAACASITCPIQLNNPTLTVNATFTLTVSGTVAINEFELSVTGACTISGGGSLVCTNVILGQTPFNPGAKIVASQSLTSTIASFNISGNLNLFSPFKSPNRFRNAVFNIANGTVTVGGSVTSTNENGGNISTLTMATGAQTGTLVLSGATPFSLLSPTGTNTITLNGTSALVNYNRAGAQTVYASTYTNLTLSGSGAKTTTGATVNGVLSREGTATAAGSTPGYGAAATLQYKGSASQTTGVEFPATFSGTGGVIINNINGVLLSGSHTINSILTLTSGAFSVGANTLTLANGSNLSYGGGSLTGGATSNLTIGTGANITLNSISGGLNNFITNRNITLGADLSVNGTLTLTAGTFTVGAYTLTFQNSNIPIVRTSGTITTASNSNLSFGSSGNTGGNAFTLPVGTFTSAPFINNLSIYRTNSLTLNEQMISLNGILLCNGPLNTNGNLTLLSTAGGTALIDGSGTSTIAGNVTMQRYLPSGFGYKYFSSPFQGATVSEFGDNMDLLAVFPSFYNYDESKSSAGWVTYTNSAGVLNPLYGYAVNFGSSVTAITADVTGVINNGNLSRTMYNNNNTYTKGFNLVGNPYPSPIDWDAASGWTKTNIDNALYFFKASTTDQYGGTYSSYIGGVSTGGSSMNLIPSMQGFFIHVSNGTFPVSGTLGLNNNVRITDLTHSFTKSNGLNSIPLLRLTAGFSDDPSSADPMVIYFDEKASPGFDGNLDALKLMNTDLKVPNLYSVGSDGYNLSINALPVTEDSLLVVPLGLMTARVGSITFRIKDIGEFFSGTRIYLYDDLTKADQNLDLNKVYTIYLNSGEYNNRFSLRFMKGTAGISDENPVTDLFNIYSSHGILIAEIPLLPGKRGTLIINNISGQILFRKEIYTGGYQEIDPQLKTGIYFVRYISGNVSHTKKIFILDK